jgi:hypothetical protein
VQVIRSSSAAALILSALEAAQVVGDSAERIGRGLEPLQLRVVTVAAGLLLQDLLRQQPLAPSRQQTLRVKVLRVDCP